MRHRDSKELATGLVRKHIAVHGSLDHYRGIVTLHALARLADADPDAVPLARAEFLPYVRGERPFECFFPNYLCGGLGAAFALWRGFLPEAADPVRRHARLILDSATRDKAGIFAHPTWPDEGRIWIDAAFAVTPFLLFAGLAFEDHACLDDAVRHTSGLIGVLRNPANGLFHQCRGFTKRYPDGISRDHWSRGNGWGIYALAELACHLPDDHPRRGETLELFRGHVAACLKFRNAEGLWYQEMTEPRSYVETSGSALILYALGAGIEAGVLDASLRPVFDEGVAGLRRYVNDDFDVFHTCAGCLCPGEGSILDYMARPPVLNDSHAFGPLALAFGQAHRLAQICPVEQHAGNQA